MTTTAGWRTLTRAFELLDGLRTVLRVDSTSPWIELDVEMRGSWLAFGIWKLTGALYRSELMVLRTSPDLNVAMGEDPISVEALRALVDA